jgi:hypothetical protein
MLEPIPFAGMVEIDESFDRTASHMFGEYVSYNEPVAWRNLCVGNIGEDSEWIYNEIGQGEPLYTHPVKELTDEEILREAYYILMREQQKKAQEK